MSDREQRGLVIAAVCKLVQKGSIWLVPSQSGPGKYTVSLDPEQPHCTCQDHETRGVVCKHIFAAQFVSKREIDADGVITETQTVTITEKRKTYPQMWPQYNAAQMNEKEHFLKLLRDLCSNVPVRQQGNGRPAIQPADAIFAMCFKVYSGFSGRRFMTDLRDATANGFLEDCPHYNSVFKYFEDEAMTPILTKLILAAATPLKEIESDFAIDSSGFTTSRFDRWFDHKYGKMRQEHDWVKVHIATGVKTNVVSAVEIHDKNANDSLFLPTLLETTAKTFTVRELSADKAYVNVTNMNVIDHFGVDPFIPFRNGMTGKAGGAFSKAFHFFSLYREEFMQSYHKRSNVESTFSMIKAKFGDAVRSKTDVAMKNEVLCKVLNHNICCLISAMYELGIEPQLLAM